MCQVGETVQAIGLADRLSTSGRKSATGFQLRTVFSDSGF